MKVNKDNLTPAMIGRLLTPCGERRLRHPSPGIHKAIRHRDKKIEYRWIGGTV